MSWSRRKHVTDLLPQYVQQCLDEEKHWRVERHLAECDSCQKTLVQLQNAHQALTESPLIIAPDTLWKRIDTQLPANAKARVMVPQPIKDRLSGLRPVVLRTSRVFENMRGKKCKGVAVFSAASMLMAGVYAGYRCHRELPEDERVRYGVMSSVASWRVDRLQGAPRIGDAKIAETGSLKVGESLVTGNEDKARVEVADIGQVDVAPNSRLRLIATRNSLHRLALDRGELSAKVLAPPRLFMVDTPSAVAVDLGCAYTLKVDKIGNTRLQVTTGHVSLENGGKGVDVPAGAVCLTRKGVRIGTPFFAKAPTTLISALQQFDFEHGGDAALNTIVKSARVEDTLTLFYLLPRVTAAQRERVIDALLQYIAFPEGVTRAGVRKLDPEMLLEWKAQMDFFWY